MVDINSAFELRKGIDLDGILIASVEIVPPTVGLAAPIGSLVVNRLTGFWYRKVGAPDIQWILIPDPSAARTHGQYGGKDNASITPLSQTNFSKIVIPTTLGSSVNNFSQNADNELTYTGSVPINATIHMSVSAIRSGGGNYRIFEFAFAKDDGNGPVYGDQRSKVELSGVITPLSLIGWFSLENGDKIYPVVRNLSNNNNILVTDIQVDIQ